MIKQEWESEDVDLEQSLTIQIAKTYKFDEKKNHQQQLLLNPYDTLRSANPILPPGVHHEKQQPSFRHKYFTNRQILNKTAFPQVHAKKWNKSINLTNSEIKEIAQQGQQKYMSQFDEILYEKKLIYKRINNESFNRIGNSPLSYFSSIFLNLKKASIKSKNKPLFEYLIKSRKKLACKDCIPDVINFRSDFQSGNLFCVVKDEQQQIPTYELYMQNDTNTKGCTQWFYFCAQAEKRIKIKIKIMNFYKPTSLYMKGMKVLASTNETNWRRVGTAIKYTRINLGEGRTSYSMEFLYEFQNSFQPVYFSYGYPYKYTALENIISKVTNAYGKLRIINKAIVCQSYLGNNIYMLNISNNLAVKKNKPIIYIIGRQHPGETPASFIMEGIIKTLLSNREEMIELRDEFLIKVVPMVNVDGVINGNYRSNISGNDVNRQWFFPSKKFHPEIYHLKEDILSNKKYVKFFLDVHAHSRKMNSFFYGSRVFNEENRFYPFVCSKLSKFISYNDSTFCDDPSKKTTARVVLENELAIKKSLTFEVSFYGWEDEMKKTNHHFNTQHFESIGETLALGLFYTEVGIKKWCNKNGKELEISKNSLSCKLDEKLKSPKSKITLEKEAKIQKNCLKLFQKWKKELEKMKSQHEQAISEGSSLDPQHFQLKQQEEQQLWDKSPNLEGFEEMQKDEDREVLIFENRGKNLNKMDLKLKKVGMNKKDQALKQQYTHGHQSSLPHAQARASFYPGESNLKNSLIVKQLESELQINKARHRRYQSKYGTIQPIQTKSKVTFLPETYKKVSYTSLDPKNTPNYKQNISEMKNALKFFITNKSSDEGELENYKSCLKNGARDTSVVFRQKEKLQLKNKYTKI